MLGICRDSGRDAHAIYLSIHAHLSLHLADESRPPQHVEQYRTWHASAFPATTSSLLHPHSSRSRFQSCCEHIQATVLHSVSHISSQLFPTTYPISSSTVPNPYPSLLENPDENDIEEASSMHDQMDWEFVLPDYSLVPDERQRIFELRLRELVRVSNDCHVDTHSPLNSLISRRQTDCVSMVASFLQVSL